LLSSLLTPYEGVKKDCPLPSEGRGVHPEGAGYLIETSRPKAL